MKIQTKGFTLIELVVVIVILGILAATALPKFVDLGADARVAAVNNLAGAMKSAAELAHSKCVVVPGCVAERRGSAKINIPDGTQNYMFYGYPTGLTRPNDFSGIKDWVDITGFTIYETGLGPNAYFYKDGAPDSKNCYVYYIETYNVNIPPSITTETKGCKSS